jgi:hypothetical protein
MEAGRPDTCPRMILLKRNLLVKIHQKTNKEILCAREDGFAEAFYSSNCRKDAETRTAVRIGSIKQ